MADDSEAAVRPVDEGDLSQVLKRLMSRHSSTRKSTDSRRRLANDVLTREYLDAGLRLISKELGAENGEGADDEEFEDQARPFFDWLSQSKVIDEVAYGDLGLHGSAGTLRDRWPFRSDYIEDLLTYSLWVRHWAPHVEMAEAATEPLASADDFAEAVHLLAYYDLTLLRESPTYRLSLIAAATADRDTTARQAVGEMYQILHQAWHKLYDTVLTTRDMPLRPGMTLDDVTILLSAMIEGLRLRMTADPDTPIVDPEHERSLLGTGVLSLIAGCIDPGDGRSVEDVARDLARKPED
jgi:hypothetical protein